MNALTLYLGRKGTPGTSGIDGLTVTDVDGDKLENPILDSLHPNVLSKNAFIQWSRDSVSPYKNRYGDIFYTVPSSTINYCTYSEDFTQWSDVLSLWSIVGPTTDPEGGNNATIIELDGDTRGVGGTIPIMRLNFFGLPVGKSFIASFYIKRISGTIDTVEYSDDADYFDLDGISNDWERKVVRVGGSSASTSFGISPRGDSGAQFAVFGVQFQQDVLTQYIKTTGLEKPLTLTEDLIRRNDSGYLIEGAKQNLCRFTSDLTSWGVTDGQVTTRPDTDAFGFKYARTSIIFSSLPTVTLSGTTEPLTESEEYNVSFYAYIEGGSLSSLSLNLGDGELVLSPQPSVAGWVRISVKAIAGIGDTITILATSDALNAKLNLCAFQIEQGELTSYIASGVVGQSRTADLVSMDYSYNAPLPSGSWAFVFGKDIQSNSKKKTIFSNGESGANEFSLSYEGETLSLNNGGNIATVNAFNYEKAAVVYDGANVKFYGEKTLLSTMALSSTSFIASSMYLGSNNGADSVNGYLSGCMFYNESLSDNDIIYLLGV